MYITISLVFELLFKIVKNVKFPSIISVSLKYVQFPSELLFIFNSI